MNFSECIINEIQKRRYCLGKISFSDASSDKLRPALIISNDIVNQTGDYLLMQITTVFIFPNPAKNNLSITLNAEKNEMYQLNILDMHGNILQSSKELFSAGINNKNLNIAFLPAGVYLIKITSASVSYVLKFAKQ